MPWRCISRATWLISSSDGVIRPDRPIRSAFSALAAVEDHLRRHHHAEVDHVEVVAGQHHADDVLADVVHVALDRGHDDLAVGLADIAGAQLLRFDEGQQVGDRLLHHARGLHHLRQEHLAGAEQVADHVHAVHQRAFDDVQRPRRQRARFLGVGLDVLVDAVHERMAQARAHGLVAPGEVLDLRLRPSCPCSARRSRAGVRSNPCGG